MSVSFRTPPLREPGASLSGTRPFVVCLLVIGFLASALPGQGQSRNPISSYFSRLFDESRLEIALGRMLVEDFTDQMGAQTPIASDPVTDALVAQLSPRLPRALPYRILIMDSPIPAEMPFPGGTAILTRSLVDLASSTGALPFLVGRNLQHIALRHPVLIMKKEGLYPRILKNLKKPALRRDPDLVRAALRDYLGMAGRLDKSRADREAILLCDPLIPQQAEAVAFLKKLEAMPWPMMPWDWFDLPVRIKNLQAPGR